MADNLKHERKVTLTPELADVVGAERFLAAIKTTAHLWHPHIKEASILYALRG